MATDTHFAILGAGNGGLAMAGDLILNGFTVSGLYDRFETAITPVQDRGGIEMVGEVISGFAPVTNATTDMATAVDGADVVVVVVPTFGHAWIAEHLAPLLVDGQIVLLTPGYPGGSLCFLKRMRECGLSATIDIAETNLILYSTRIVGPAQVGVKGIKNTLFIAALPASRTEPVLTVLKPAIPQLEAMANVLEVGFNCTNPYSHVPTAILNWARVEQDTGEQHFDWHDWVTPDIKRVEHLLQEERRQIMAAAGLRFLSEEEFEKASYGGVKWKIAPIVGEIPPGSRTIAPRYITEDIPMGLVAYANLADALDVAVPIHNLMIDMACLLKETDYRSEGRSLADMGIDTMPFKDALAMVNA